MFVIHQVAAVREATQGGNPAAQLTPRSTSVPLNCGEGEVFRKDRFEYFSSPALDRAELSDPSMVSGKEEAIWDPSGKGP
jgi:hypothetical protein